MNNLAEVSSHKVIDDSISIVKGCLIEKARALEWLVENIDEAVNHAIDTMYHCEGHVIISGMGKSGIIGKKIAATLASTGTPSFFVHPAEAYHGDLGMIRPKDVVLLISNSGETDEVIKLLPSLKRFGNKIISIVNNPESTLGTNSDIMLDIHVEKEICPNNLAPTTSTTITLALADSLAVALMKKRNFQPEEFAVYHPGGSLGRRLLTKVKDEMLTKNLPFVSSDCSLKEVLFTMTESKLGVAIVMDGEVLKGIISDGDLRRALLNSMDIESIEAKDIMTYNPVVIDENVMLSEAEKVMKNNHIKYVLVNDKSSDMKGILEYYL